MLEGYLALAVEAADRMPIHFFGQYRDESAKLPDLPPETERLLADPAAWFGAERHTAVAAVTLAAELGFDDLTWQLTAALTPYFDLRGHQDDWHSTHALALEASRRAGSAHGEAIIQRNLGQIHLYQDSYAEALVAFEASFALYERIGDAPGMGTALAGLVTILRIEGENDRALERCHEALKLFAEAGDRHREAVVRISAGTIWLAQKCYAPAKRWFTDALELAGEIGDRRSEAEVSQLLGELHSALSQPERSRVYYERALAIWQELSARPQESALQNRIHGAGERRIASA